MSIISKIFISLVLTYMSVPAFCATYYVSTTGYDGYIGSKEYPWLSPSKAAGVAVAGDIVLFEDGIYNIDGQIRFSKKGTSTSPITFKSVNKHGAVIQGPLTSGNGEAFLSIGVYSGAWLKHQEMYLVFDGLDLSGGLRHTIQSAGGGQLVIKNCKIHDSGNDPIKINSGADYVLIENNEIYNSGRNESNCEVNDCNSDGIDITSSDYVTVRNNHVHDIASWGIYTKKGSENSIIENNLIHDVLEGGIGLGESTVTYNAIARNNILYNIKLSCLQFAGAKESKFYNNTCYNVSTSEGSNWAGMRVAPAQHTAGARLGDDKYSRNVEFYNNIIVLNNSDGVCFKTSDPSFNGSNKTEHIAQLKMDYNVCYNLQQYVDYKWTFEGYTATGINNWNLYTAGLGNQLSAHSVINDNPLFLDVSNKSSRDFFMIDINSPAKANGINVLEDVLTDYYGLARQEASFDIGAVMECSSSPNTPDCISNDDHFIIDAAILMLLL